MNDYTLYDAITGIDEAFIERADRLRLKTLEKKSKVDRKTTVNVKMLTRIAASIIMFVFAFSAATAFLTVKNAPQETPIGSQTEATNSTDAEEPLHARMIQASNIDELSGKGGNAKDLGALYFSMISIPSIVRNNSEFTFEAAFGLSYQERIFSSDTYLVDNGLKYSININNGVYETDCFQVMKSTKISFFGETDDYKEYLGYARLEELKFDPGIVLIEEDNRYRFVYTNINDIDSLPYKMTVPCSFKTLKEGQKGWLYAGIKEEYINRPDCDGNGSSIYFYCSGDYIGFGKTEEEAYHNAFNVETGSDNVEAKDHASDELEEWRSSGTVCCCADKGFFRPIDLMTNNRFEKNSQITLSFEVEKSDNILCDAEFYPENIYNPNYRTYFQDGKQYCEISFYADAEKNGQIYINAKSSVDNNVVYGGITIYTANSSIYTYVSVASMETAMRLAGQRIDPGVICTEDSYKPIADHGRPASIYVNGTILWTDSAGYTHPAKDLTVEVYVVNSLTRARSVSSVTTDANGYYSTSFATSPNETYNIYSKIRIKGAGIRVMNDSDNEYYYSTPTTYNVGAGSQTKSYTFSNSTDLDKSVSVHQGLALASNYIKSLEGSYYDEIDVEFPSASGRTEYDNIEEKIYIYNKDAFDWDVLEHEYGHYVEDNIGIILIGLRHSSKVNLWDYYGYHKYLATNLAWTEGWATYFAINLQKEMGASSLNIPYVGDTYYTDIEPKDEDTIHYDIEYLLDNRIYGECNEASIAAALYDLTDPVNSFDYDNIYCSSTTIWNILKADHSFSFSYFVSAFYNSSYSMETKLKWGLTLSHLKMAASLYTPSGISTSTPPTFSWVPQGGSDNPLHCNNKFKLRFYDSSYNLVLETNYTTNDYLALTSSQWSYIQQNCGAMIYCCVVAYQTSDPETGPYMSELIAIDNPLVSK